MQPTVTADGVHWRLVEDGRFGSIHHFRGTYLQDWIADPAFPMVWRLDKSKAGSGALGDKLAGLLKAHLGDKLRVRADTFGYAQRSYFGAASAVELTESSLGQVATATTARGSRQGNQPQADHHERNNPAHPGHARPAPTHGQLHARVAAVARGR